MFDTVKAQTNRYKKLTTEELLKYIDDYSLFSKYLGNFKIGGIFNSPLRKDPNPSFCIYYSKKFDKLFFTDYGTKESGDVFKFLQLYFNLPIKETLQKIWSDLETKNKQNPIKKEYDKEFYKKTTTIEVVRQPFTKTDIDYWSSFGITEQTLKKYNVHSIKYYLQNGIVKGIYREDCPMFAYKIFNKFKIYRPLGNKYIKWRCNTTNEDIQGYEQLPKRGKLLIITKSLKDVMVLNELGISSIAPSSETTKIPNEAISSLKQRFETILVLYDRDITGIKSSRRVLKDHGFKPMLIHKKYKSKDISDCVLQHGKESCGIMIKNMILKETEKMLIQKT